jgi:hypothetical protein
MRNLSGLLASVFLTVSNLTAGTVYVSIDSTNPVPPYTNWATAATVIQDAVTAASWGDLVLVSNGVYRTGGAFAYPVTNRVVVNKFLTLQSVNGPEFTVIEGYQVPGTTNGDSAVRCVYLSNGAVLSGFTLTNGATRTSGNEYASSGGGVWASGSGCIATNCVLIGNASITYGGGAYNVSLFNCKVIGNSATLGGGAYGGLLDRCMITGNSADGRGGGVFSANVNNCALFGNSACYGGGADNSQLRDCTITGNYAKYGGGVCSGTLNNCIVFFNSGFSASANYDVPARLNSCCTTPLPLAGTNNLSLDPQLASAVHLSANSPCRGAGDVWYAVGRDIDGEAWGNPPSMGCDEYYAGAITGAVNVAISAPYSTIAAGFPLRLAAIIDGRSYMSVWNFGDQETITNRPYVSHAWSNPGDYMLVLTAYNETYPQGVSATLSVHVQTPPVHYVALGSTNPVSPFSSWVTAAADIQSAVDSATVPGALVVVNDGVYDTGGRVVHGAMTNRVVVDKALTLQSLNGAARTVIRGYQVPGTTDGDAAIRCLYLGCDAVLSGFTLTNGATRTTGDWVYEQAGGGVFCQRGGGVLNNCVLVGNSALHGGGGACSGTLNNCLLTRNMGTGYGGGAHYAILNNCTVALNDQGAYCSFLNNCIIASNTVNGAGTERFNHCCTTPLPSNGTGNFTNAPLFVDLAGGDLHLQSNSPCINAGNNACVTTTMDLDGDSRIVSGTVDIGAYEYQGTGSVISYAWLQQYGLPTDGSADFIDSDQDGMSNWQEWICGTNPTNALSALRMISATITSTNTTLSWQSVAGVNYSLERSADLGRPFGVVATNIVGQAAMTSYADTNATGSGPFFYRVGVQTP